MEITKSEMNELVDDIIPTIEDDNEALTYIERYELKYESADYYLVKDKYDIEGTGSSLKEALENYGEQYKYECEDSDFPWVNEY